MASDARIVLSACGHWWRELLGDGNPDPEDGEIRSCHDHAEPSRYPVVYLPDHETSLAGVPGYYTWIRERTRA